MNVRAHIKEFRLFDLVRARGMGKDYPLDTSEGEHLRRCAECQEVVDVFARQFRRPARLPDTSSSRLATPRFIVGDHVQVAGPSEHRGKRGIVTAVATPKAGDFVYRYGVTFLDGRSDTFFGFELELEIRDVA